MLTQWQSSAHNHAMQERVSAEGTKPFLPFAALGLQKDTTITRSEFSFHYKFRCAEAQLLWLFTWTIILLKDSNGKCRPATSAVSWSDEDSAERNRGCVAEPSKSSTSRSRPGSCRGRPNEKTDDFDANSLGYRERHHSKIWIHGRSAGGYELPSSCEAIRGSRRRNQIALWRSENEVPPTGNGNLNSYVMWRTISTLPNSFLVWRWICPQQVLSLEYQMLHTESCCLALIRSFIALMMDL